jgi:hypothetical protein
LVALRHQQQDFITNGYASIAAGQTMRCKMAIWTSPMLQLLPSLQINQLTNSKRFIKLQWLMSRKLALPKESPAATGEAVD